MNKLIDILWSIHKDQLRRAGELCDKFGREMEEALLEPPRDDPEGERSWNLWKRALMVYQHRQTVVRQDFAAAGVPVDYIGHLVLLADGTKLYFDFSDTL